MDANDLYGLPLERFVPERTALAKALRAAGEREEAARVAKLAKPSVAAWAVNQLVRTQREAVGELFEAGDALGRAQDDVVAGRGSGASLREAAERERAARAALTSTAQGLLSGEGQTLTPAMLERVSETLHAAALEEGARRAVEGGCLTKELRHIGLGEGAFAMPGSPSPARREPRPGRAEKAEAEARAREAAAARKQAKREQAAARNEVARAERVLAVAATKRDRAAEALAEAEQAVTEAKRALVEAQARLDAAGT